jgi:hypothetical protein
VAIAVPPFPMWTSPYYRVSMETGCGGEDVLRRDVAVDVDSDRPRLREVPGLDVGAAVAGHFQSLGQDLGNPHTLHDDVGAPPLCQILDHGDALCLSGGGGVDGVVGAKPPRHPQLVGRGVDRDDGTPRGESSSCANQSRIHDA